MTPTAPAKPPAARYVYAERPRCPKCGSPRLLAYRSTRHADGAISRHCQCADCRAKIIVVLE